jgi:hypothetical protein
MLYTPEAAVKTASEYIRADLLAIATELEAE